MWNAMLFAGFLIGIMGSVDGQRRPPNYSLEEMPLTSFNCRDKIIGGYYADPETDCQMFHVCVKVPGLGVQDFKFLCPNDTSFDQENQICDDWYNIDCETSTLFYSDNFDLYRLGSEGVKLKSSTRVNNAVSDVEDNVYLQQRSDRGENVGKDLLRGSQSGNFFSNRGGRDDEELDKDELYKPKKKTVNKVPPRKVVTNKRPITQTVQTTTEAYRPPSQYQRERGQVNRNYNRAQNVQKPQEQPTTVRYTEVYRQRNNYNQPTTQNQFQTSSAATPRTEFFRTNFAQTTNYYSSTTTQKPTWQTTQSPKPSWQQPFNAPTTFKPFYETTTKAQNYYNPTTLKPNNYFQGTTYRPNYFETQRSSASPDYNPSTTSQSTTQKPNYYNNFNNRPETTQAPASFTTRQNYQYTSSAPEFYNGFEQGQESNNNYETQKLYRINLSAAVGVQPPQSQIAEDKDEFLKTAHSQNLAQSAFNQVQNNYKNYNTSVSANYNLASRAGTTQRPQTTRARQTYAPTTTTQKPKPFAATPKYQEKPKEQDAAYDYAYYDDGTASEYENLENLEEFSRTTAKKRST